MAVFRNSLIGLGLGALTLGLLAFAVGMVAQALQRTDVDGRGGPPAEERVLAARVERVVPARLVPTIAAFGEVRATRQLDLRAVAAGRLVHVAPGLGDGVEVREGDLLFALDPAEAQAALSLAEADAGGLAQQRIEAVAALELAQDDLAASREQEALRRSALQRQQDLLTRGSGSAAASEEAQLALFSASQAVLANRQAVLQAEARIADLATQSARQDVTLGEARRRLAETRIVAPFDGVLDQVQGVVGAQVSGQDLLARVLDPGALELAIRLSTDQYARLLGPDGGLLSRTVAARFGRGDDERVVEGAILRAGAAVADGASGRLIFARLNAAPGLQPGDFVGVAVAEPALDGVALLPERAIGADGTVLVLDAEDRLQAEPVRVLRRQGDLVLIDATGLDGRDVVRERTTLLGAGIRVRPLREGDPGGEG